MDSIETRHEKELNRLYAKLEALEPGSEEYDKVLAEITKALEGKNEFDKIESDRKNARTDGWIKIGTFLLGLILAPLIDLGVKKSLTKTIGTIEQMETFTSTPGRSISSWFRMK